MKYNKYLDNITIYKNRYRDELEDINSSLYHKLDWNESSQMPCSQVKDILIEEFKKLDINYYPDTNARLLISKLASYNKISDDSILVYNGSDGALKNIFDTFLNVGSKVFVLGPTYTQIDTFIISNGAKIISHVPKVIWNVNILDELVEPLGISNADIVYINNPNNPTGVLYNIKSIGKLAKMYKSKLFIIDEAYYEFCGETSIDLIELGNIILVRTFSKALGLAGLRLGYTISSDAINRLLSLIRNGKEVNSFAQRAGIVVLDNIESIRESIKNTISTRNWFCKVISDLGIKVYNTNGNYVVIRHQKYKEIIKNLFESNIIIRDRSTLPQMHDCIRITIGSRNQMEIVLNLIRNII